MSSTFLRGRDRAAHLSIGVLGEVELVDSNDLLPSREPGTRRMKMPLDWCSLFFSLTNLISACIGDDTLFATDATSTKEVDPWDDGPG